MGKLYYAVVKSSLDKLSMKDGKGFPEKSGENVTFYASAQEAQNAVGAMWKGKPDTFDFPNLHQDHSPIAKPNAIGMYTVELSDAEISRMTDVTPAGSAGRLSGPIDASTVKDVSWSLSRDAMHDAKFTNEHVPVGSVPQHNEIVAEALNRETAWNRFEDSLNATYESQRARINMRDPLTARSAEEAFGARGFMQQDPASLPAEQAYCQQYMRMMTYDKPLNIALKTDAFHQSFNARLDMLESKFPSMSTSELATTAMRDTIKEFEQSALTTRNLHEQQIFGEMRRMNDACIKTMNGISENNLTAFATQYVNTIQSEGIIGADYDGLAAKVADEIEGRDSMGMDGIDDDFDSVGDWE